MQDQPVFEQMAATLEASGDYKILRRLVPRSISTAPLDPADRVGVILDVETTGIDHRVDEIIELGMVRFSYSAADVVTGVTDTFQAFREPPVPISAEITSLTGITNDMVAGQRIEAAAVEDFDAFARAFDQQRPLPDRDAGGLVRGHHSPSHAGSSIASRAPGWPSGRSSAVRVP